VRDQVGRRQFHSFVEAGERNRDGIAEAAARLLARLQKMTNLKIANEYD